MYNRRKYITVNNKKNLHKVKKQWVTISLALFVLIGGGEAVTHVHVNAASTNNNEARTTVVNSALNKANVTSPQNTNNQTATFKQNTSQLHINININNSSDPENDPIYNQNIHFNAPHGIFGDVEGIIPQYTNGKVSSYNVYAMYNPNTDANYGAFNWGRFNTNNFSQFRSLNYSSNNNIAIPNAEASGTIINNNGALTRDHWNNPIEPDARLAYFAVGDSIALAYSNNSQPFHMYQNSPIINNYDFGIQSDFRDPFVMQKNGKWFAYIAGGIHHKVFVLSSNNGINWHHNAQYDISYPNMLIEMPNIMIINDKPILFTNNENENRSDSYMGYTFYTLGHFDEEGFFVPNANSAKLTKTDAGLDHYAANYTSINNNTLVGFGKLQDWGYEPGGNISHVGSFTLPRVLQWDKNKNDFDITPIEPGMPNNVSTQVFNNGRQLTLNPNKRIDITFNQPKSTFNLKFKRLDGTDMNINFLFSNGNLTVTRKNENDMLPMFGSQKNWNTSRTTNLGMNQISNIRFYLDNDSIEAYVPEAHRIVTWADYTRAHNANYQMTTNIPVQANIYEFNLSQSPQLNNVNNIASEYSTYKADFNNDMNILNIYSNDSINNSKALLNNYFINIQNDINDANDNITKVNDYNGDARQHVFIALANNDMDMANTKLYQARLQLKKLDDMAMPYLDASAADARIANYYKNSISNFVASANQSKANSAASSADASIKNSIANSYAKSADSSIASSYSNSIAKSVSSTNQSKANSVASSADASIKNSIANSYAKSADSSIASSYSNSVAKSVSSTNQSKANSVASSADVSIESSIASSYAKSADQSIARSEADKSANHHAPTPAPQPNVPPMPTNNVIPTIPTSPTLNVTSMASSSANVASISSSEMNNSVSSTSNTNSNINYHRSNITISLVGLAKHAHFYDYRRNRHLVLTNLMKKHANVLQATINPNHKVTYKVRIGKRTGYLYGYLHKLVKPTFMNKRYSYVHIGEHTIKLPAKLFNRIKVNCAVRYAGKNYVKYYVSYRHKHCIIYGALPKVTKVNSNKSVYKKYYQVIPKRYHYVKAIKPLMIYDNKRFTKRTHRGSIRKGITVRVKRLAKNGGITRFQLTNSHYITGLKKYVKLIK